MNDSPVGCRHREPALHERQVHGVRARQAEWDGVSDGVSADDPQPPHRPRPGGGGHRLQHRVSRCHVRPCPSVRPSVCASVTSAHLPRNRPCVCASPSLPPSCLQAHHVCQSVRPSVRPPTHPSVTTPHLPPSLCPSVRPSLPPSCLQVGHRLLDWLWGATSYRQRPREPAGARQLHTEGRHSDLVSSTPSLHPHLM